jgi:glucokinase
MQDVPHRTTRSGDPIACIGAGTGLGQTFLTAGSDNVYQAYQSEGGHADFAARSDLQYQLQKFLKKKFNEKNRVSVERVVRGQSTQGT